MGVCRRGFWGGWVGLCLLIAVPAWGEPYLAVREGLRCSGCHTNMTGGGMRKPIVGMHARDMLRYPRFLKALSGHRRPFHGEINKYVRIGADLRALGTAVLQERPDGNGRVSNNTAFRGRVETTDINVGQATGYLQVHLVPDLLTFYIDQQFAPTTDTREAWGMLRLPWHAYVKAGRMFLPYGLQLQDDTAFIRGGRNGSASTDFSFKQRQAAFEVGFEPDPFSIVLAVSKGAPGDRDVRVTATVAAMLTEIPIVENILLGGSASRTGPPGVESMVFGFFAGTNLGPLTYLGEVDFRSDRDSRVGGGTRGTFIHYSELNYLLLGWLNCKLTFDYADDDGDVKTVGDDSENRVNVGLEPFLNRFLQARIFYRIGNGVRTRPDHNQDVLSLELHAFF